MTDYRDPNYRDPPGPDYRDPTVRADANGWSTATWGWIAGLAVVALILIFAFGMSGDRDQIARDTAQPPSTTGQRQLPATPPTGSRPEAPSTNPAPAPVAPAPAPQKQ
jgi:hypothetical protein